MCGKCGSLVGVSRLRLISAFEQAYGLVLNEFETTNTAINMSDSVDLDSLANFQTALKGIERSCAGAESASIA